MIIRTLRPCLVAGRNVATGLLLDLPEGQAQALVDAGDAGDAAGPEADAPAAPAAAPDAAVVPQAEQE